MKRLAFGGAEPVVGAPAATLDVALLEDRILYSATPLPVDVDAVVDAVPDDALLEPGVEQVLAEPQDDSGSDGTPAADGGDDSLLTTDGGLEQQAVGDKLYWADFTGERIVRSDLDGSNVEDVVTGISGPGGIAIDDVSGKVYWSEFFSGRIRRADLDGSNVEDVVTGVEGPSGIDIDESAGKLYFVENGLFTNKIRRVDLDGSNDEDLITSGLSNPEVVHLDVAGGKMYWTDSFTSKLQRSNLDGSSVEDIVTSVSGPRAVAIDNAGGKVYWIQDGLGDNRVRRADLDGGNVEDLVTSGLTTPYGLAIDLDESKLYWTDRDTNKIQRSDLDGGNVEDILTGVDFPVNLVISNAGVDPAPVITGLDGDALTYPEGSGAQVIDQGGDATVVDPDSTDFQGGTLTVRISVGGVTGEDILFIRDQGPGAGNIWIEGSTVRYGPTAAGLSIGTYSGGTGGAPLVIALDDEATPEALSLLLRNITYENTEGSNPTAGTRTVGFDLDDGDGNLSGTQTTSVEVQSTNDEQSLDVNLPLALNEGGSDTIDNTLLATSDPDHAAMLLSYTVSSGPTNGQLFRSGVAATSFTQADVDAGLITYQHDGGETVSDSFTFTVDDGEGVVSGGTFSISVYPVNDEQQLVTNSTRSVGQGMTATLGNAFLRTTDVDNTADQIVYTVNAAPANGTLLVDGTPSGSFTQQQVDAGMVAYQHDGSATVSDSFSFTVDDGEGVATASTFNITVTGVDFEESLDVNLPLSLGEGAAATIDNTLLSASDADNTAVQLVYTIGSGPTNGAILVDGFVAAGFTQADVDAGLVSYQHDGGETTGDSFTFSLDDGSGDATVGTFQIGVTPVNDEQTLAVNAGLTVNEGAVSVISNTVLSTTDADNSSDEIVYTVTGAPPGGKVLLSGAPATSFTQAHINAGLVTYQNDGGEANSDSFSFTVDDGAGAVTAGVFTVNITPQNDEQSLSVNLPLGIAEGGVGTITGALLSATDVDNTAAELAYSVTSSPSSGAVLLSGAATTGFTQDDLDNGLVTYQHDGGEATADSFTFSVDDGQGSATAGVFMINVTPINDEQSLALNSPLVIAEGATGLIDGSLLAAADPDNTATELTYTITGATSNGVLLLSGSTTTVFTQAELDAGLVSYTHDGGPSTTDQFTFNVDDGAGTATAGAFSIVINNTNDAPLVSTPVSVTIAEDGAFAPLAFTISDEETAAGDLTVTATSGDQSLFADAGLTIGGADSDRTISGAAVADQSGGPVVITLSVSDGVNTSHVQFSVTVTPAADAPIADADSYRTSEGATLIVAGPGVLIGDSDADADAITAVLDTAPANGTLALRADGGFTYTPDAGFVGSDQFTYRAHDGALSSAPATVTIEVAASIAPPPPVTDPPPDTRSPEEPVAEDPPSSEEEPSRGDTETPAPESPGGPTDLAPPSDDRSNNPPTAEGPREVLAVPPAADETPVEAGDEVAAAGDSLPAEFTRDSDTRSTKLDAVLRRQEVRNATLGDYTFVLETSPLWDDLNQLDEMVEQSSDFNQLAIGSALGMTSSLTAGYVLWLMRGGYLLSSMLAQMPAWSFVDPLPVLEFLTKQDEDDDEDSVEGMLEKHNRRPDPEAPQNDNQPVSTSE
ncbi:MAG: cadherin-like domain-containing protein [Planctomycetota bacterium]